MDSYTRSPSDVRYVGPNTLNSDGTINRYALPNEMGRHHESILGNDNVHIDDPDYDPTSPDDPTANRNVDSINFDDGDDQDSSSSDKSDLQSNTFE